MTTRPKNDPTSIAVDARRILAAARADAEQPEMKKRLSPHELDAFAANISALEAGDGARSTSLQSQIAAGAHTSQARARLFHFLQDIRDDAKLVFPADKILQHAFGVGASPSPSSTTEIRHLGHVVLAAAHESPAEAAKIGLDAAGLHTFEDLLHALDGSDLAHVEAATARHTHATSVDSIAHLVAAETAHLRLLARRVFRGDESKLASYANTLPRHQVTPRAKAPVPASAPAG